MAAALQTKIDNLNKPKGSLGRLESLALQIGLVQQTLSPRLMNPRHVLFAADHGIECEGVSASPREVTRQQMENFSRGGGGVNMFCRQHGFSLRLVDVGIDRPAPLLTEGEVPIIDRWIAPGTKNFLHEAAMSAEEMERALNVGVEMAEACCDEGCNVLCVGEMGIGNTTASSAWMHFFLQIPLDACVGAGSGLNAQGINHKYEVLKAAIEQFSWQTGIEPVAPAQTPPEGPGSNGEDIRAASGCCCPPNQGLTAKTFAQRSAACRPYFPAYAMEIMRWFGGLEMVAAVGCMLRAAELGMVVLVDGFIMTACLVAAYQLCPAVMDYAVFGHVGVEQGHALMLRVLGAEPLLHLGLRLGEGTGALCAYPLLVSAVNMLNEMDNFGHAGITKYF